MAQWLTANGGTLLVALVVAALSARGESQIDGVCHIDRGYEDIAALFGALGAKLTRTP